MRGKDRFVVMDMAHYHLWAAMLFGLSLGLWWSRHRAAARWLMLDPLGWTPAETFESGIRKTVQWYLANPEWAAHVQSGASRDWVQTQDAAHPAG